MSAACAECGHAHYNGPDRGYSACPIEGCACSGQQWASDDGEHRYVITAPWGDEAEADTYDAALVARRQLGNDAHDAGIEWSGWLDSITIIDRGFAPQEEQ